MNLISNRTYDLHGVLLLDKHQGESSNNVLQKIKRLLHINKAGHTGTLDPLATGMLPICLGEATKFAKYFINSNKRYHVIARLGSCTDTSDANGKLVKVRPVTFHRNELDKALDSFRGNILQVPSMFSAIKHHGRPLYKYARQGITVERNARPIIIHELLLIRWEYNELELEIYCSKGTYIRTLIEDLGEKLCCGAHVIMLRRLQVSYLSIENMITLSQLQTLIKQAYIEKVSPIELLNPFLLPVDSLVLNFPEINLQSPIVNNFKKGQLVQITETSMTGLVRITEGKARQFIGIAEINSKGHIMPRRLLNLISKN